jgi:hypothetical protein
MTEAPKIHAALNLVMKQVGAVKKNDRNDFQQFMFRGVDAVVNAVYPALVEHRVTVQPKVLKYDYSTIDVGKGAQSKPMGHARVIVEYTFTSAEDGSTASAAAAGEAFDSGDKATPKAMSVALRTALLQSLMLPTDDPEPDAQTYERATAQQDPVVTARVAVADAWRKYRGELDTNAVAKDYMTWSRGELFANATAEQLLGYANTIKSDADA